MIDEFEDEMAKPQVAPELSVKSEVVEPKPVVEKKSKKKVEEVKSPAEEVEPEEPKSE